MLKQLRPSVVLFSALTLLTGVFYPAIVTAVAQVAFPHQANGSILYVGNRAIGSELIGQSFSKPEYFWGRLSATSAIPCNAAASSGSNLGPLNATLKNNAKARIAMLRKYPSPTTPAPVDLVTASGSGLDPHISLAAAEFQVPRVAAARKMSKDAVRKLVREATEGRQCGLLGEPRVNVLRLNFALDQLRSTQ
jgi:potassium-transporting ATPase KdpC subunit